MDENKLRNMALFILEIIIIQDRQVIIPTFSSQLNQFFIENYKKHLELFSLIYDIDLLETAIEEELDIIPYDIIMSIVNKYKNTEDYAKLVEEVGIKTDKQINELALLFNNYCINLLELYYADPKEYYPKGFPRIKQ